MCDYSLYEYRNRLAVEGEELTVVRFGSGTVGMVSSIDRSMTSNVRPCAVCVPPGARITVTMTGPLDTRKGTFTVTSLDANQHRDAIQFDDAVVVGLQKMPIGTRVVVESLVPVEAPVEQPVEQLVRQ